jgi:hypothetical protein
MSEKSLIRLDKKRHFGTCHPPENNCHFHQDGFYFDAHGNLVEEVLDAAGREKLRKLTAQREADVAAEKARLAVYKKAGVEMEPEQPRNAPEPQDSGEPGGIVGNVDLIGWAKGLKQYAFFTVRNAAQAEYAFVAKDAAALVEWMVSNGKISEDQAKVAG